MNQWSHLGSTMASTPSQEVIRHSITLPTFHADQARAYWKFQSSQSRRYILRCGRRYGKTAFGATWLGDGFARGWECAWYAPQHKTWSEVYSEMADYLLPILDTGSSKGGAVMRGKTGGRIDWWTLENSIAGRGRKYRRVVIDEAAFGKDGDLKDEGSLMEMYDKVIRPTLFDYGGELLVMSNSAGKKRKNFLWQISPGDGGGDVEGKHGFVEHHAETKDNPWLPKRMPGETPIQWMAKREYELAQLKKDNDPLVFDQEHRALFVDWSGVAFFSPDKWMVNGMPQAWPKTCETVFATVDTALKTGYARDGTGVIYWLYDPYRRAEEGQLSILDWDLVQIEGASLEIWLPVVFQNLEEMAKRCGARRGHSGVAIEDKGSGTVLLQQAAKKNQKATPIDTKLTGMGKDERAISCSGYHYRGLVKITDVALNKVTTYKRQTQNHMTEQVTSFRIADEDADEREDDLLDCYCYGLLIALGTGEGF